MTRLTAWVVGLAIVSGVAGGGAGSHVTAAQQRDTPAARIGGNGEISGTVISDDLPPRPIRRALVTLSGEGTARSVVTDDDGRFVVSRLPQGRFTVTARKAAYLPAAYGALRPGRPGTAIQLGRDDRAAITMTMTRGAVVSGAVTDVEGQPMPGVQVGAIAAASLARSDSTPVTTEFVTTDDRGLYRIFGLMPGEYVITATRQVLGTGQTEAPSDSHVDAILAELARRDGRAISAPTSVSSPAAPRAGVTFAPTYFPGTPMLRDATRVKVAAAEERNGLDFQAGLVRVAAISGTVSGVADLASVQLSVIVDGPRLPMQSAGNPVLTRRPDDQGRFAFGSVAPGRYRITARASRSPSQAPAESNRATITGGGGGNTSGPLSGAQGSGDYVYAVADVDVLGDDIGGISLALQPGSSFSGRVVLDASDAAAAPDLSKMQVAVSPPGGTFYSVSSGTTIGNTFGTVRPVQIRTDGTFGIDDIGPGTFTLRLNMPADLARTWRLKSAVVAGRDLLDAPLEFEPGVNLANVVLTVTDLHSELAGTLRSESGGAAPDVFVIVFPSDRALWRAGSRRMMSTRPGSDGRYSFTDLPAGNYLLATLADVDADEWHTASVLEPLAAAAVSVRITDGRKTSQDLRISK
jgi:hypothetical protein